MEDRFKDIVSYVSIVGVGLIVSAFILLAAVSCVK